MGHKQFWPISGLSLEIGQARPYCGLAHDDLFIHSDHERGQVTHGGVRAGLAALHFMVCRWRPL